MRKPTKRWEVEIWTHKPSGTQLSVYYDKKSKQFWSPVANKEVFSETQQDTKVKANELANILLSSEGSWKRVLIIWMDDQQRNLSVSGLAREDMRISPKVGLSFARCWIRTGEDGLRYTRSWDRNPRLLIDMQHIERFSDVKRLYPYWNEQAAMEVDYSDELWGQLIELSSRLRLIRGAIRDLLVNKTLVDSLSSGMPGLWVLLPKEK